VGILAGGNLRIADFSESFDGNNDTRSGVVGTAYQAGQMFTLLDLYALVEKAMPEVFAGLTQQRLNGSTRMLLAEDNKFFAKLVSSYLQLPGLELTVVEDGQQAWDLLHRDRKMFDIVVSDIEMPRMNGFELVQRIKSDPALRHMPVLALTSLADEDSRRRGLKAGFDEYAVKIDKQDLLSMVHRFVSDIQAAALPSVEQGVR
jgi:two-component system chemotaxis sensor kinase CheA